MTDKCSFCGGEQCETRRETYLYSHDGKYLLIPNTPVEVCATCGMRYYEAKVLREIERHFFAIERQEEAPDQVLEVPVKEVAV
jgi:YgiT-type zinc finger domain-containing protein